VEGRKGSCGGNGVRGTEGSTEGSELTIDRAHDQDGGMNPGTTRTVTYNLDKPGNRTSIVDTGVTRTYAPNSLNQYTSAEGLTVSNGNEHQISAYDSVVYTYRNDERLIRVTGPATYDLAYDALGRCVKRTLNGVTTFYIYDGEKPILEIPSTGGLAGWEGRWGVGGDGGSVLTFDTN
jgi:YD repeat-containing protein